MPEKRTIHRARTAKRAGRAPTTQAGEFVREEIHHIRRGKHGARSPQQAVAIGLSKARRSGVDLPPPARGRASKRTRISARHDYEVGHGRRQPRHRPRAVSKALKRAPRASASHAALSRHARSAASRRSPAQRSAAAHKAVRTRSAASVRRPVARTRVHHGSGHRSTARHTTTARYTTARRTARHTTTRHAATRHSPVMIRKLQSGGYRLYSRHVDPRTRKRRTYGTFSRRRDAERHQRQFQHAHAA